MIANREEIEKHIDLLFNEILYKSTPKTILALKTLFSKSAVSQKNLRLCFLLKSIAVIVKKQGVCYEAVKLPYIEKRVHQTQKVLLASNLGGKSP